MSNTAIKKALDSHSIAYVEENDHVFASVYGYSRIQAGDELQDLTGYSRRALLDWLGY